MLMKNMMNVNKDDSFDNSADKIENMLDQNDKCSPKNGDILGILVESLKRNNFNKKL